MSTPNPSQTNQKGRKYKQPVAWLLGRQLVASLKGTLLYAAFGRKADAREWMVAEVFPSDDQLEADWNWMVRKLGRVPVDEPAPSDPASGSNFWKQTGEFWFDYLSDTGDGMKATYSIAYLCLSDLQLPLLSGDLVVNLPRGEFLFVGGDTTYHLADYATLHNRFQTPFTWAYQDTKEAGKLSDETRRPIFGIPGNHDYYDMLDGFRRQFRLPYPSLPDNGNYPPGPFGPQLRILGFERFQETSHIALRLPFQWMIWGLDTEVGKIDERQRDFFKSVNKGRMPDKLIVGTSAPTTVFGKFADRDDEKCAKAFFQLELPREFLPRDKLEEKEKDRKLKPNQIRLDLSGDVHQYARYWGPAVNPPQKTRANIKGTAQTADNYASVVSGLGGAFHHPSTTYVGEIREHVLYPSEENSRSEVTDQIFSVSKVMRGGNVWLIGALLAMTLAFAAIASDSSRPAIHNFPLFTALSITEPKRYTPLVQFGIEGQTVTSSVWRKLGIVNEPWTPTLTAKQGCNETQPMYFWGRCRVAWPREFKWGLILLGLSLLSLLAVVFLTEKYYVVSRKQQEVKEGAAVPQAAEETPGKTENDKLVRKVNLTLWPLTLITLLFFAAGLSAVMPYRAFNAPFGNSLLVLTTMFWSAVAVFVGLRYSDWLFEQAARRKITGTDWIITWVVSVAAAGSVAVGLWVFGKHNLPAYLVSDIIFVALLVATIILLPLVAWKFGGAHQQGLGKSGMLLIGFWHWVLQVGVALLLIKKGTWLTILLAVLVFFVFKWIGKQLMRANRRWWLVVAWLAFGGIILALPSLVYEFFRANYQSFSPELLNLLFYPHTFDSNKSFATYEWWFTYGGWWQIFPIGLAGVFGALLSCMWLGWYFGVCLGFHGHNNETGGAARIEKFKQFIRIRLTENDLTAYVISVDQPEEDGKDLDPKIIDVIRLHA